MLSRTMVNDRVPDESLLASCAQRRKVREKRMMTAKGAIWTKSGSLRAVKDQVINSSWGYMEGEHFHAVNDMSTVDRRTK
jgi:hypothetical protein